MKASTWNTCPIPGLPPSHSVLLQSNKFPAGNTPTCTSSGGLQMALRTTRRHVQDASRDPRSGSTSVPAAFAPSLFRRRPPRCRSEVRPGGRRNPPPSAWPDGGPGPGRRLGQPGSLRGRVEPSLVAGEGGGLAGGRLKGGLYWREQCSGAQCNGQGGGRPQGRLRCGAGEGEEDF